MGCGNSKHEEFAKEVLSPCPAPAPSSTTAPASQGGSSSSKKKEGRAYVSSEINCRALVIENTRPISEVYLIQDKDLNKLGSGSFGTVVKAEHRQTQVVRAVKAIKKNDKLGLNRVRNEVNLGRTMMHANIVRMCESFEDKACIFIVMELCTGGSVEKLLKKEARLQERHAVLMIYQLLCAVLYMHNNCICHRDIKPGNMLLLSEGDLDASIMKVADFGLSCQFQPGSNMTTVAGTPGYSAPDVLKGRYDESCDLWSTGVTFYELLSGELPFDGKTEPELTEKVKRGNYGFSAVTWQSVSAGAKDLVRGLLAFQQKERLKASQALQTESVQGAALAVKDHSLVSRLVRTLPNFCCEPALKRVALQVVAAEVSEVHLATPRRLFTLLDADGDGVLSEEELLKGLSLHGVSDNANRQEFRAALEVLCPVTYTEFLGMTLELQVIGQEGVIATTFRFLDKDGDGLISADDLESTGLLLQARGREVLGELTIASKAGMSLDEFRGLMCRGKGQPL